MMPPDQETTNTNSPAKYIAKKNMENLSSSRVDPSAGSSTSDDVMNPSFPSDNNDQTQDQHRATPAQFSVLCVSLRPITLKFEDVSYTITLQNNKRSCFFTSSNKPKATRTILNGVSGVVKPGELLAMLGPSGSGKTTLLTALAGRLPGKVSGSITYNDLPFTSSIKRKTGFVAQDDVLYPHLTVLETLSYAALLRLPSKLTKEEKMEQVEMIILELGLTRCKNSVVGGPIVRGVSGGERKRVSIGIEMLVNPSLLLLDEPTSGLDSTTAQRIVGTLRWLAKGGRSVVTTIHQPSSRLFRMFDKVMVLSDGCPIYSGSATRVMDYFASIGYVPGFNFVNPADFLLDLANGVAPDTKQDDQLEFHTRPDNLDDQNTLKQSLISSYRKNLYPVLKDEIHGTFQDRSLGKNVSSTRGSENQWTTSWLLQFTVLLSRGLKERKHESYSGLRIFQVMTVAIFAGLLWWHSDTNHIQDQVGLLFFFSIFWGFFPLFNATFAFPLERPMLTKERNSGMYRLSSYFFARTIGDLPMELILPSIFVTITYWMGGLRPSIITYIQTLLIVLFNVLVSQSVGLALGAVLMDVKQGVTLSSVVMLVFLLAGGYYIQHIPEFIIWLKYISFSHYCYKLLIGVQYSMNEIYECGLGEKCRVFDYPAIKALEIDNSVLWADVLPLLVMLVGYRVIAYMALRKG